MDQGQALTSRIEALFARHIDDFTRSDEFQAIEGGRASRALYDAFIENVARAHLTSPQLLGFLYSMAPPAAADDLLHNLLEELGRDDDGGAPHPALLRDLVVAAGLGDRLPRLETLAREDIRRVVVEPLLYGTLRDVGLAALGEVVAFECMLSQVAGRIARALEAHRRLSSSALTWFTHHSEVDVRHAEQGLATLVAYVRYYDLGDDEAMTILEMTLRENVFARRYFRDLVLPAGVEDGR